MCKNSTMVTEYELNKEKYVPLEFEKRKWSFLLINDLDESERKKMILNVVKRIEKNNSLRELILSYDYNKGDLNRASLKSKDGIIEGTFSYLHAWQSPTLAFGGNGGIKGIINFNSNKLEDRKEYLGLVKIFKEI